MIWRAVSLQFLRSFSRFRFIGSKLATDYASTTLPGDPTVWHFALVSWDTGRELNIWNEQ